MASILVISSLVLGCLGREEISFNYGWLFRRGLHQAPSPAPPYVPPVGTCSASNFSKQHHGIRCDDLFEGPEGLKTADECRQACCNFKDAECAVWQFSASNQEPKCWFGLRNIESYHCENNSQWLGESRAAQDQPIPPVDPNPGPNPPEAHSNYDDSDWEQIQLPHDGLIASSPNLRDCPTGCSGRSYIPRDVMWYRKSFVIPKDWAGDSVWLHFDGVFREATIWLNGAKISYHECGYTSFRVRLDNETSLQPAGKTNSLTVFVDPDNGDQGGRDSGSGWWYEGGGIYRHVRIIRVSQVHIEQDGLFAYSNLSGIVVTDGLSSRSGLRASQAILHASVSIANDGNSIGKAMCVSFVLFGADGNVKGTADVDVAEGLMPGNINTMKASIPLEDVELWSTPRPYLYNLSGSIFEGKCSSKVLQIDQVSTSTGFRNLHYDANTGFFSERRALQGPRLLRP